MRSRLVILAVLTVAALAPSAGTHAATWAPAGSATIHPGVQLVTEGAQCTANFIFEGGGNVYIGQAAHCSGLGAQTDTDGCTTPSLPLGTPVTIEGASKPGTLVYSSWLAMQAAHETNPDACAYNDIGLVQIDPADVGKVNPSIPHWGGPTGINTTGTQPLDMVYSYGNSELRLGLTLLSPKSGISQGTAGNGWTHQVSTITPGIPGDSGSAFLDASGRALGVLSTLSVGIPGGVSNNISDLAHMLDYLRSHGGPAVNLVQGTQAFNGSQLPLGI